MSLKSANVPRVYSIGWWLAERKREETKDENTDWGSSGSDSGGLNELDQAESYKKDDVVIHQGSFFKANDDIPANTTFVVGITGETWTELDIGADAVIAEYAQANAYIKDQPVRRNGIVHIAKSAIAPGALWSDSDWEPMNVDRSMRVTPPVFVNTNRYVKGEAVIHNDDLYIAESNLTPGDFNSANWLRITNPKMKIGRWVADTEYEVDNVIIGTNGLLRARSSHTSGPTYDSSFWQSISLSYFVLKDFNVTSEFKQGEIVNRDGELYRSKTDIVPGAFDETQWDRLTYNDLARIANVYDWEENTEYVKDQLVAHNGILYRANIDYTSGLVFSDTNLTEMNRYAPVPTFSAATGYLKDQAVYHAGELYICNAARPAGVWNEDDFTKVKSKHAFIRTYTPGDTYEALELAYASDGIYVANVDVASAASEPDAKWSHIGNVGDPAFAGGYDGAKAYQAGKYVVKDNNLYITNGDVPANTAFALGSTGATFSLVIRGYVRANLEPWSSEKDYGLGDLVVYSGRIWVMNEVGVNATFNESANDQLRAQANVNGLNPGEEYMPGDHFVYLNELYIVETSFGPGDDAVANSRVLLPSLTLLRPYEQGASYIRDTLLRHNNAIYLAVNEVTNAPAEPTSDLIRLTQPRTSYRGVYDTTQAYLADDVVVHNGGIYKANSDITENTAFIEGESANEWLPLGAKGVSVWEPNTAYKNTVALLHQGSLYVTNAEHTSPGAFDGVNLTKLTQYGQLQTFSESVAYAKDQLVVNNGKLYYVNADREAGAWDAADFTLLSTLKTVVRDYVPGEDYEQGELCVLGANIYRANADVLSAGATMSADWVKLGERSKYRGEYAESNAYLEKDMVVKTGLIFFANSDIAANTTFIEGNGANEWKRQSEGKTVAPDWSANTTYAHHELVIIGGVIHRSNSDRVSTANLDDVEKANWTALSADAPAVVRSYAEGDKYVYHEIVVNGDEIVRCVNADGVLNAPAVLNEDDWDKIGNYTLGAIVREYETNKAFRAGEVVRVGGRLLHVSIDISAADNIALSELTYTVVSGNNLVTEADVVNSALFTGDVIIDNANRLWKVTVGSAVGAHTDLDSVTGKVELTDRSLPYNADTTYLLGDMFTVGEELFVVKADTLAANHTVYTDVPTFSVSTLGKVFSLTGTVPYGTVPGPVLGNGDTVTIDNTNVVTWVRTDAKLGTEMPEVFDVYINGRLRANAFNYILTTTLSVAPGMLIYGGDTVEIRYSGES